MSIRCYDDFIEDEDLRPVGQKECRKGTLSCEKSVIGEHEKDFMLTALTQVKIYIIELYLAISQG